MKLPALRRRRAFMHGYTSTACFHDLHARCRKSCKFCASPCTCACHRETT